MIIGEVIETKTAFKPNQKDTKGNVLPIGSILVRLGGRDAGLGQVKNVYARPALWSRRVPLIGEHLMLLLSPTNDSTTDGVANFGYIYLSPVNSTDDIVLHAFHSLFKRSQSTTLPPPGQILHDKKEVGYTFPKKPRATQPLQPFEGDDLFEGRFGQSIRFGSTVEGKMNVYDKKPTWKGGANTDPIITIRVKKPSGSSKDNTGKIGSKFNSHIKYTIEDLKDDDASIYITTTQKVPSMKVGFNKNMDAKKSPNWSGTSQIIIDASRIVLNARTDKTILIGSSEIIVTGKSVLFQSDKYKVYLDDLMDFLQSWLTEDYNLATAAAQYSTACGPTAVTTNMAKYIKLKTTEFSKFKRP